MGKHYSWKVWEVLRVWRTKEGDERLGWVYGDNKERLVEFLVEFLL